MRQVEQNQAEGDFRLRPRIARRPTWPEPAFAGLRSVAMPRPRLNSAGRKLTRTAQVEKGQFRRRPGRR